jgi:hypothetical protein
MAALERLPDPVIAAGSLRVAGELLARAEEEAARERRAAP